ncbi:MAG: hypothetical protein LBU64_06740 [Planctomycetota bacterium]|jgi:hypothetical protein|nr:hypothetical protein [Planctomycetota bacterium]
MADTSNTFASPPGAGPDFSADEAQKSPATLIKALGIGLAVAFILSWVYGPLDFHSPLIFLNLALVYFLGLLLGRIGEALLKILRLAGTAAAVSLGVAMGLAAAWFSWASYLFTITDYNFEVYFSVVLDPGELYSWIYYLAENPIWAPSGRGGKASSFPPLFYYAVWAGELLTLTVVPVKKCRQFIANHRLCDSCGHWLADNGKPAVRRTPPDLPAIVASLKAGDASVLRGLEPLSPEGSGGWLTIKGYACPRCPEKPGFVRVFRNELVMDKKSKEPREIENPLGGFVEIPVDLEGEIFAEPEPAGQPPEAPGTPADPEETA